MTPRSAHRPVRLPIVVRVNGRPVRLRPLTRAHAEALRAFARRQPAEDLMFSRRDLTRRADIEAWIDAEESGEMSTILATESAGRIVGYAATQRGALRWNRHVAEIRILTDVSVRGQGLGATLLGAAFQQALAAGVTKLEAQMPLGQSRAQRLFARLGFRREAVLTDQIQDAHGKFHDMVVMSYAPKHEDLQTCDACGGRVVARLSLEGQKLCWSCYELREAELGTAG